MSNFSFKIDPGRKDFMEILCDVLAFVHVQAIKGIAKKGMDGKKILAYGIDITIYNLFLRQFLLQNDVIDSKPLTTFVIETGVMTGLYELSKSMLGKKSNIVQSWLEVSASMGLSELYIPIKKQLVPGAFERQKVTPSI